jgi:hypothetical protein
VALSVTTTGTELAAAAGAGRALYTAQIPQALVQTLLNAGLAFRGITSMNGVVGTEIRFTPQATQFVVNYFKVNP